MKLCRCFMKGCPGCKWEDRPTFAYDADITVYWPEVRPCWEPEDERSTCNS